MYSILRAMLLVWALACTGAIPASAAGGEHLRVGTFSPNRPWEFRDSEGQFVGFEVDLVHEIGKRLGRRVEFVEMPFKELFPALNDGKVDLVACSLTITGERSRKFDFTQPYYRTSQGVATLKGAHLRSLKALAGKRLATEADSTNETWLRQNKAAYDFGPIIPVTGLDEAVNLLEDGRVDAYFGDLPALLYRLLDRSDIAVTIRLPTDDYYGIALARGSLLTPEVDKALSQMKRDGSLARIHQRWFGMTPLDDSPVVRVLPRP